MKAFVKPLALGIGLLATASAMAQEAIPIPNGAAFIDGAGAPSNQLVNGPFYFGAP